MKTRYFITGGAGFIGSHLTESLLRHGHEVYILDDESTGSRRNLHHLESSPSLHFNAGSIMENTMLEKLAGTCHVVVHLAAAVGVKYVLDHPLQSIMTNVVGTEHVLRACHKYEKPLFLASTSEVYGLQTKAPLREDDFCVLGATSVSRWSYACSKALDEFMALAFHHQGAFPVTIGRFFNTVGPRQSPAYGMVLPRLVDQALTHQPMTVFGDGSQTRTFTHVADAVDAIQRLLESPSAAGEVYNIGGTQEVSILSLAEMVRHATHSRSPIQLVPYDQDYDRNFQDMPRRVPDVSKLNNATGFEPKYDLMQIIDDVVADRRRQL
ncbi:MAG: NAD-dependent epimerase/dehydratase family protein [Phycisphaerales bacterium]|nr:NAD-dependent epimerase/dehydratase family protein [Phycisphaerales bacterium]